jgi:hypothetical protein
VTPLLRLGTVVLALVLCVGCSEQASCGPCPPPVFANVGTDGLPSGTRLSVCVEDVCEEVVLDPEGTGQTQLGSLGVDTPLSPAAAAGHEVTVEARHGRSRSMATAALRHHDGGDGTCSCSYTSADVSLPPLVAATG